MKLDIKIGRFSVALMGEPLEAIVADNSFMIPPDQVYAFQITP